MKKLLTLALGTLLACTLTACGGSKGGSEDKPAEDPLAKYSKVVLVDEENSFHAVGGWGEWTCTNDNKMTPTSIYNVAKINTALADKLAAKGSSLKYLYVFENAPIGVPKEGVTWTANAKVNGEVVPFNGTATLKGLKGTYNEATEAYTNGLWIPNPLDSSSGPAHCESLTANVFMPTYQQTADADGFAWDQNPVVTDVTEAGGKYTVIVAQYDVTPTLEACNCGLAAIRTGDAA